MSTFNERTEQRAWQVLVTTQTLHFAVHSNLVIMTLRR